MNRLQESPLPDLGIPLLKVQASRQQGLPGPNAAPTHGHHTVFSSSQGPMGQVGFGLEGENSQQCQCQGSEAGPRLAGSRHTGSRQIPAVEKLIQDLAQKPPVSPE